MDFLVAEEAAESEDNNKIIGRHQNYLDKKVDSVKPKKQFVPRLVTDEYGLVLLRYSDHRRKRKNE